MIYICTPTQVCKNLKNGKRFPYIFLPYWKTFSTKNHLSAADNMIKESMFISTKRLYTVTALYEYKTKHILCIRKEYLL